MSEMVQQGVERMASSVATLVPHVLEVCKQARKSLQAAMATLDSKKIDAIVRGLDVAAASADSKVAAASVERLLRQALRMLLDEVFDQDGELLRLINNAKNEFKIVERSPTNDRMLAQRADGFQKNAPIVLRTFKDKGQSFA